MLVDGGATEIDMSLFVVGEISELREVIDAVEHHAHGARRGVARAHHQHVDLEIVDASLLNPDRHYDGPCPG